MVASGVASRLRGAGGALAAGARSVASPRRWRQAGREIAALPGTLRRELWPLGADTAFDRRIGGDREVAFTACALEDLKRIEHSFGTGVTVNDVVLAVVAGAIRGWLATHHEPSDVVRVQVPVSMHHRDEDAASLGNRDSFLFCDLPISEPDPRRRLAAINAETRTRKEHHDPDELYSFFHSLSHISPLYKLASGVASGPREFALSVSNVPGPRDPVRLLGRERERALLGRGARGPSCPAGVRGLAGRPDGVRLLHRSGRRPRRRRAGRRPRRVAGGALGVVLSANEIGAGAS